MQGSCLAKYITMSRELRSFKLYFNERITPSYKYSDVLS